jgi:acyl dehydratase
MPMNLDAVGTSSESVEREWSSTDCLLYALGVGAGSLDATGLELEFTTENSAGIRQQVLPTFAALLGAGNRATPRSGQPGGRGSEGPVGRPQPDAPADAATSRHATFAFGTFDPAMLVHGEQSIELHGPIPTDGKVRTTTSISGIYDKGSGAVVLLSANSVDARDETPRFSTGTSLFIRGEGGFGGPRGPEGGLEPVPEREPDEVVTYETRPDQALLYRLSGDRNPLHSDPAFARRAGFERPILHGLCTYGFTGRALLHTLCGSDPSQFGKMAGRFTRPVEPGDILDVAIWREEGGARYRTTTRRGVVAIDWGTFKFAGSG